MGSPNPTTLAQDHGLPLQALVTPALLLYRSRLERNIASMAALVDSTTRLRPHAKTHKCAQVAALQLERGAIGITTATVWEAAALAAAGIDDILIANEVVGQTKIERLTETARVIRVTVAVDNPSNARDLSSAADKAGVEIGVVLDIDIGMGRCGVRSIEESRKLAQLLVGLPGLRFRGVTGYEGHCALEPDTSLRTRSATLALDRLLSYVEAIEEQGIEVEVVSSGGTGTYDLTGARSRVTEIQAGSYAFMDTAHAAVVKDFDFALTVLSTIISRHTSTIVLDAGKKTLGLDTPPPLLLGHSAKLQYVAEEHTVLQVGEDFQLEAGAVVELVPSYCPVTVNLHDVYHVVDDESLVIDIWPIIARGAGWSSSSTVH